MVIVLGGSCCGYPGGFSSETTVHINLQKLLMLNFNILADGLQSNITFDLTHKCLCSQLFSLENNDCPTISSISCYTMFIIHLVCRQSYHRCPL